MSLEGSAIRRQFDASYAYVIYKASSLSSLIFDSDNPNSPILLSVQNGYHADCSVTLSDHRITIGGNIEDDILLSDSEIGEIPVQLDLQRTLWGTVLQISTDRDDVSINGDVLSAGNRQVTLPTMLSIKSINVYLESDFEHSASAFAAKEILLFSTLILFGFLFIWGSAHFPSENVDQFSWETTAAIETSSESGNHSLHAAINKNISDLNLDQYIQVQSGEEEQIIVTGSIPSSRLSDWQQALAFIDVMPDSSQFVIDVQRKPDLRNVPPISIVKLHDEKQLILQSGDVISLNQTLVDDWTLIDLTVDGMTLSRLDEVIDVQF